MLGKKGLKAQREREAAAVAEKEAEQAQQKAEAERREAAAAERAAAAAAKKKAAAAEDEAARRRLEAAAAAAAEKRRQKKAEREAADPPAGPTTETATSHPQRGPKKGREQPKGSGQPDPPAPKQTSDSEKPQDPMEMEPVLTDALPHRSNVAACADTIEQWLALPCGRFRRWEAPM